MPELDASELQRWLRSGRRFALVDVLPREYFEPRHLPGAKGACVFEVTFLEQIRDLGLAADDVIVLYGAGRGSLDSAFAAQKLARAGFTRVHIFTGGRAAWAEADGRFEGGGAEPPAPTMPADGVRAVDAESSTIEWIGRNMNTTHRGTIRIARGSITVRDGNPSAGHISIDMRSITNTDIEDPVLRHLIEAHLKSDDFFDVARFPTAEVAIETVKPVAGATPGTPNYRVAGRLTVKDAEHEIEFPAIISAGSDGALTAVAQIEIDRTRWNVLYGSGRFFPVLGKHLVHDGIGLLVKISTR
jgi:polyisoprenoid-binding protein YceI